MLGTQVVPPRHHDLGAPMAINHVLEDQAGHRLEKLNTKKYPAEFCTVDMPIRVLPRYRQKRMVSVAINAPLAAPLS